MSNEIFKAAARYAANQGWPIVQNYGMRSDGGCMCRLGKSCGMPGKHPVNDEFAVLGVAMEPGRALEHAEHIVERVRALAILHPRSRTGRYLTVSAGVVTSTAPHSVGFDALLEAALRALSTAKAQGGNRAVAGQLDERN